MDSSNIRTLCRICISRALDRPVETNLNLGSLTRKASPKGLSQQSVQLLYLLAPQVVAMGWVLARAGYS